MHLMILGLSTCFKAISGAFDGMLNSVNRRSVIADDKQDYNMKSAVRRTTHV